MFDHTQIQSFADNPTNIGLFFAYLLTFVLVGLISFTYEKTTKEITTPGNFIQSLFLSAIVACMIMLAIGDSVGRGIGLLGAMAIIRLRFNINHPRNTIFMFASFAVGIGCGVYGFNAAIIGTLAFCLIAFLFVITPYSSANNHFNVLRFILKTNPQEAEKTINQLLVKYCDKFILFRLDLITEGEKQEYEYQYKVILKKDIKHFEVINAMNSLEGVSKLRFSIKAEPEEV
ncbi:MAG: DUF4956 domain-containing protein [Bacteroidetes bacterium]|nr:DUF4956 domain-containing protein [Bacteroidota bacterium]